MKEHNLDVRDKYVLSVELGAGIVDTSLLVSNNLLVTQTFTKWVVLEKAPPMSFVA